MPCALSVAATPTQSWLTENVNNLYNIRGTIGKRTCEICIFCLSLVNCGIRCCKERTTITVKIVSQLTGDTDFAAPETLVAFALGLTLFTLTLWLNIVALYVVRKYREQYE